MALGKRGFLGRVDGGKQLGAAEIFELIAVHPQQVIHGLNLVEVERDTRPAAAALAQGTVVDSLQRLFDCLKLLKEAAHNALALDG